MNLQSDCCYCLDPWSTYGRDVEHYPSCSWRRGCLRLFQPGCLLTVPGLVLPGKARSGTERWVRGRRRKSAEYLDNPYSKEMVMENRFGWVKRNVRDLFVIRQEGQSVIFIKLHLSLSFRVSFNVVELEQPEGRWRACSVIDSFVILSESLSLSLSMSLFCSSFLFIYITMKYLLYIFVHIQRNTIF